MKNHLVYLILLISLEFVNAQNCEVPPILLEEYEKDVKHLTLIRMEAFDAEELDNVEIPQIWQDTIWEGLAAIFNSESNARDEVFDQYCIHHHSWTTANYLRISNSMYIKLDPNAAWYQDWSDGNILTGNASLDALMQTYGFDNVEASFPSLDIFTISTDQYLNLEALVDSIEMDNNIVYAERIGGIGDASRINYQVLDGERYFDFVIGWGDCPAGCTAFYTWYFKVDENCTVSFLGANGDSGIPEPINCNLSTNIPFIHNGKHIEVLGYPNPTSNAISIDFRNADLNDDRFYEVFNSLGLKVSSGYLERNNTLDLSAVPSGIYHISISDTQMNKYFLKVIRQ